MIFDDGTTRVVVPRTVHEATQQVAKLSRFNQAVRKFAQHVGEDEAVRGVGFTQFISDPRPDVIVTHDQLMTMGSKAADEDNATRVIEEQCELAIVGAILLPGKRKWEFVWRGVKIMAPILDTTFFDRFSSHDITIAPGDTLRVRLRMKQHRDSAVDVYTTTDYEIIQVFEHIQRIRKP